MPVSRLMEYRLERFPWADNILDTTKDALLLQLNETITLKVTKDRNVSSTDIMEKGIDTYYLVN